MTTFTGTTQYVPPIKFVINCYCVGDGYLKVMVFEEDDGWLVYFHIDGHEIETLWKRLKVAWRILRHGEYENNGILMDKEKVGEVVEYLSKVRDTLK